MKIEFIPNNIEEYRKLKNLDSIVYGKAKINNRNYKAKLKYNYLTGNMYENIKKIQIDIYDFPLEDEIQFTNAIIQINHKFYRGALVYELYDMMLKFIQI